MDKSQPMLAPWVAVRIAILAIPFFGAGALVRSMSGDFSRPSWSFFAELAGIIAAGTATVLGAQKFNPSFEFSWQKPRWSESPFIREPLAILHFGACALIASGLGCLIYGLLSTPRNWAWQIPMSAGIGGWIGVRLLCEPKKARQTKLR